MKESIEVKKYFNPVDDKDYKEQLITSIIKVKTQEEGIKDPNNPQSNKYLPNKELMLKQLESFSVEGLERLYLQKKQELFLHPYEKTRTKYQDEILDQIKKEIYLLLAQKDKRHEVTERIVTFIKQFRIFRTIFSDAEKPEIYYYTEGIYKPEGITEIKRLTRLLLEELYTSHLANAVIEKIKIDTLIHYEEFFNQEKKHPYLLPVKNGILNLKTYELEEFNPEKVFFNKINACYDPNNTNSEAEQFIESLINPEDIRTVQEMLGFLLIRQYKYEKAFFCTGAGSNGKSKFFELIKNFLHSDNTSQLSLTTILEDDFAACNLHHKLVNISGEISNKTLTNTDIFKRLTGGDLIQANRKFREPISFVNYAKLLFALNEVPRTIDTSHGFFRRVVIIDFPKRFVPRKEYELMSDEERSKVGIADTDILYRLLQPDVMDGLLFYALAGLDRLLSNGGFSTNKTTGDVKKQWMLRSDSFTCFCDELLVEDYEGEITKPSLKRSYLDYCKRNDIAPQSDRVIKAVLTKTIGAWEAQVLSSGVRVWRGVRLKDKREVQENI